MDIAVLADAYERAVICIFYAYGRSSGIAVDVYEGGAKSTIANSKYFELFSLSYNSYITIYFLIIERIDILTIFLVRITEILVSCRITSDGYSPYSL